MLVVNENSYYCINVNKLIIQNNYLVANSDINYHNKYLFETNNVGPT